MKPRKVKKLDPAATLAENAARIVKVRMEELHSFVPSAIGKRKVKAQHDMRIAAKRLRYVLETSELCFRDAGATARKAARDIQDVLGELHDCDVMLPRVREHLSEIRADDLETIHRRAGRAPDLEPELVGGAPNSAAYGGLESLTVYLEARRELLYERFVELWEREDDLGTWDRLGEVADEVIDTTRTRRNVLKRAEKARKELEQARRAEQEAIAEAERAAAEVEEARKAAEAGSGPG